MSNPELKSANRPWFRQTAWVAVLATAFSFENCYVPGASDCSLLSTFIWIVFLCFWMPSRLKSKPPTSRELPIWIMLLISAGCVLRLPTGLGVYLSQNAFYGFVQSHRLIGEKFASPEANEQKHIDLGLYKFVDYAITEYGNMYFFTSYASNYSETTCSGIAFRPSRNEEVVTSEYYKFQHLYGDWYSFTGSQQN